MADYSLGDRIVCKIGGGKIILAASVEFEAIKEFDIACECDNGYLILVPYNIYLTNSFNLSKQDCSEFGLHRKFIDASVHFITPDHIVSLRSKMLGLNCIECETHFPYAEVNCLDKDGHGALLCWVCRNYKHYR